MVDETKGWIGVIGQLVWRNWITLFGSSLTTVSAGATAVFTAMGIAGVPFSPYIGILAYVLLPGVFVLGLLLIPLGAYVDRRRRRASNIAEPAHINLDFNSPRIRRLAVVVGMLTLVNFTIISGASYEAAVYMESTQFCGQVCHTVMEPEFTAHLDSPHSQVKCVECHIGPGLPSLIHAKLNGLNQVYGVLTGSYEAPILAPVHAMVDAELTCGECHNPEMDLGDILRVTTDYSPDEENTPLKSVFLLHVGGRGSPQAGIHSWHLAPDREVFFYSPDEKREEISYIKVEEGDGESVEYFADGFEIDPAGIPEEGLRRMDCTDCHNRATHIFKLPGVAMNEALTDGRIDTSLPSIKMIGVEVLEAAVAAEEEGEDALGFISSRIKKYYENNYEKVVKDEGETLDTAIAAVQDIYRRNIFPKMNIGWGEYPIHIGHTQFDGCFRCHDDGHASRDGERVISQSCTICHNVIAWQEENPDILEVLGVQ